jgi:MoxR-like ATPase
MNEHGNALEAATQDLCALEAQLNSVIVGQQQLIRELVIAVFAGGHVLLEGLPGLGKTHLAKALAASLDLRLGRVQCTPDLLPADITGSDILVTGGLEGGQIEFRPGPVFANLVLIDEVNRATPRTQAALLEAMQERQVTYSGTNHMLPDPFWVLATQNPIELEGTFPLPEAQLDRFLFKLHVPYPAAESLQEILNTSLDQEPADHLESIFSLERARELLSIGQQVLLADQVRTAAINLVLATQPDSDFASVAARKHIRYGASPRALQALVRAARVRALMEGRAHVAYEDLAELAHPVLRHRILLHTTSELEGITENSIVDQIVAEWTEAHP